MQVFLPVPVYLSNISQILGDGIAVVSLHHFLKPIYKQKYISMNIYLQLNEQKLSSKYGLNLYW